eukprot:CAMPEP_0203990730 /NCGR_PEP_ID=MMETSP0360-20130528/9041_1 /ASSEMBLY_ACC=CAM_ASM_000342 /TAXON_ID=268821 /ORGANISM="Scrippsiella Hangoei, Strain SHTV-5" /LENGTH=44 /DNA_ID= /DNA_START= /DNA_END= /DNA_ORIENTATION=
MKCLSATASLQPLAQTTTKELQLKTGHLATSWHLHVGHALEQHA